VLLIFVSLAEFERELIVERTTAGLALPGCGGDSPAGRRR